LNKQLSLQEGHSVELTNDEAREEAFFVELRDKPKELPQTATKVKIRSLNGKV
jgi:hypothetical protein